MDYNIELTTRYGDRYQVRADGAIRRMDQDITFDRWIFRGIRHVKRRTEFHPLASLTPSRIARLRLTYQNGHPQYTVCDVDHGTTREWGNTVWHGIVALRWIGMTEAEGQRILLGTGDGPVRT